MTVVSLTNTIYIAGQGILRALENKTGVSNEYEPFSIIKKYFSKIKPKFQIPEFLITATHGHSRKIASSRIPLTFGEPFEKIILFLCFQMVHVSAIHHHFHLLDLIPSVIP